jgi:hypothetical protein
MPTEAGPALPEIRKYAREKAKNKRQLAQTARTVLKTIQSSK